MSYAWKQEKQGTWFFETLPFPSGRLCINVINTPRSRVAAVGTPGIGKTASTPFLIRMLLEQGQTVIYLIRTKDKSDWFYEFVPQSDGTVTTNVYPEKTDTTDIESLCDPSTYYIVDPGKTKDNCDPSAKFQAKVIIVPAPDSSHWGGSEFDKERDGLMGEFRFFPTWSYEELLLAWPILRPDMTEDQVRDRFYQFGGVPRHIFGFVRDNHIARQLEVQDLAVSALSPEQAKLIAMGQMGAFDSFGKVKKSALMAFKLSDVDNGALRSLTGRHASM